MAKQRLATRATLLRSKSPAKLREALEKVYDALEHERALRMASEARELARKDHVDEVRQRLDRLLGDHMEVLREKRDLSEEFNELLIERSRLEGYKERVQETDRLDDQHVTSIRREAGGAMTWEKRS